MAKYIGLDLGSKTIGIAKTDGFYPSSLKTLRFTENDFQEAIEQLAPILQEEKPELIIVGYPKNMDNSSGHRVEMVESFVELLITSNLCKEEEIEFVDERLTTRMAKSIMIEANLSRKKQKANKDNLAAILILETFLNKINK